MLSVRLKWKKEVFSNIRIDTSRPTAVFKTQLYTLTGASQERQRVIVKGRLLKDDTDWSTLGIKDGQKLMMIVTPDEILNAQDGQLFNVVHSVGLYNLGDTCCVNSTVQCLYIVPELKSVLLSYASMPSDCDLNSHLLTKAIRDFFKELDRNVEPVVPMDFLSALCEKLPCIVRQHDGAYYQTVPALFWQQILKTLSQSLGPPPVSSSSDGTAVVKTLFGIDLISRKWGGVAQERTTCGWIVEQKKYSAALGRDAIHLKHWQISELPKYLIIRFMRLRRSESNKIVQIIKRVDYPLELDMYEYCTDELKQQLRWPYQGTSSDKGEVVSMNIEMPSNKSQLTGIYHLVAVLAHKGRHFVASVKQENGKWFECADDKIIPQREVEITKLDGGGRDQKIAHICMYKARVL